MNIRLQIVLIIGILAFTSLLFHFLLKKKLHLKYCLVWILAIAAMLVSVIFPNLVKWIAGLIGIQTPSNFIFAVYGLFTLVIMFALTVIVSHMNTRIFRLVQYQALIEERLRKMELMQEENTTPGILEKEAKTLDAMTSKPENG